MTPVELPAMRKGSWYGVLIEPLELDGNGLWTVTVRQGLGRAPRRRWFPDHTLALAHAADQADLHNLPLLNLTSGASE
ncbi:MAG: hypothetical protein ABJA20_09315 [Novosphingobium sp.]